MSLCNKTRSVRIYVSDLKILRTTFKEALFKKHPELNDGRNITDSFLFKQAMVYAL